METLLYSKEFTVECVHPKRDRGLHAEDVPQRGCAFLLEGHPAAHHGRDAQARMEVLHLRAVQGPLQVLQGPGKYSSFLQGLAEKWVPGLVNFVLAVAYHLCLALPGAFTQPGDHLLSDPCTHVTSVIQGSAKRRAPGWVNAAGKARQKWEATARTKFTKPGDRILVHPCILHEIWHCRH